MGFWRRVIGNPTPQDEFESKQRMLKLQEKIAEDEGYIADHKLPEWQARVSSDMPFANTEKKRILRAIEETKERKQAWKMKREEEKGIIDKLFAPDYDGVIEKLSRLVDYIDEYGGRGGSFTPPPQPRRSEDQDRALQDIDLRFAREVATATTTARVNELKAWRERERRKIIGM